MIGYLARHHIGNLRDGANSMAHVIRRRCVRAAWVVDSVAVYADDDGDVYVPRASSPLCATVERRHPRWLVGTYSLIGKHDKSRTLTPDMIAVDLCARADELVTL